MNEANAWGILSEEFVLGLGRLRFPDVSSVVGTSRSGSSKNGVDVGRGKLIDVRL